MFVMNKKVLSMGVVMGLGSAPLAAQNATATLPPGLTTPPPAEATPPATEQAAAPQTAAPAEPTASAAPVEPAAPPPPPQPVMVIADGSPVSVKDGDFKISPPQGWEVYTQRPDLTLLAQPPMQEGVKYQRTLQVAAFSGPRYIDAVTAKEFEEKIPQRFSQANPAIYEYRVRNQVPIELNDGRRGLLFYTEFQLEKTALMQAHILVSSTSRHYLVTFTDVAEHFEGEGANQYLAEAWTSMVSTQLGTPTPERFSNLTMVGSAIGGLIGMVLAFVWWRRRRAGQQFRDFADQSELSGHGVAPNTNVSAVSTMASSVSMPLATSVVSKSGVTPVTGVSQVSMPMTGLSNFSQLKVASQQASVIDFSSHGVVKKAEKKPKEKPKEQTKDLSSIDDDDDEDLFDDDLAV
ncbi:MAG: hypothetical protein FJ146_13860 [Deltaproteobacteria bacterium]|nr:hypothetical protein [Deltaproteobacteria bacterium]